MAWTKQWWSSGVHFKRGTLDLMYCLTAPFLPQLPIIYRVQKTSKAPAKKKEKHQKNQSWRVTPPIPQNQKPRRYLDEAFSCPSSLFLSLKTYHGRNPIGGLSLSLSLSLSTPATPRFPFFLALP